ncbi:hypothetical protein G9P44_003320 [Scheffersomyces stipitis]|nr:hypothetical protein G9P44_003320 [Scheffersomyces stipitis]
MNGNFNNGLQQTSATAQQYPSQPYGSYYIQQGQPQTTQSIQSTGQQTQQQQQVQGQQQAQHSQSQQPQTGASASDYYVRYQTSYGAAPPNYSMYQQSIPGQLSQPQPQHYNQMASAQTGATTASSYGSAAAAVASSSVGTTSNTQSTPIQDTINSSSNSTVGQYQPPGIRPRVTTTMWEDEKTLCYQVDANNVSVVRRADNNMINGTKLLNVAQMTRGRRDGILKSEKVRHVVKIGSMHLKGVWIPFERALAMAQREGIVDLLYPLFVRDIKRVIQSGVTPSANNAASTGAASAAAVSSKATSTPTPAVQPSLNSFYSQYGQQYGQQYSAPQVNGTAGTASAASASATTAGASTAGTSATGQQSPQQATSSTATTDSYQQQQQLQFQQQAQSQTLPQSQQQQVYGYQQPYYAASSGAPNQYYPYNPTAASYSSYGNQPVYSPFGYVNPVPPQMPHQAQQPHQQQPQPASLGQTSSLASAQTSAANGSAVASSDAASKKEEK